MEPQRSSDASTAAKLSSDVPENEVLPLSRELIVAKPPSEEPKNDEQRRTVVEDSNVRNAGTVDHIPTFADWTPDTRASKGGWRRVLIGVVALAVLLSLALVWTGYRDRQHMAELAVEEQKRQVAEVQQRKAAEEEATASSLRKREEFARRCSEDTQFGIRCFVGGTQNDVLTVAYARADEKFLSGIVSLDVKQSAFGSKMRELGFTVLLVTNGKEYWVAELCANQGFCKLHEQATEPNPWSTTIQPPPESLFAESFFAGKIVAVATLLPPDSKRAKLEAAPEYPDYQSLSRFCRAWLRGTIAGIRVSVDLYQGEAKQREMDAQVDKNRADEVAGTKIEDIMAKRDTYAQCAANAIGEADKSMFSDESLWWGMEVNQRLVDFTSRHTISKDQIGEITSDNIYFKILAYIEQHGLVDQLVLEDFVMVEDTKAKQ